MFHKDQHTKHIPDILIFVAVFLFFFLSRCISHFNLMTGVFDQFYFDNPLWNTIHGKPLFSTLDGESTLGGHFTPILFLLALPYLIFPSPLWMFGFQSLFVAGIALLIFKFAKSHLPLAETKLILFLLTTNVSFRYMGFNDFHPDVIISFLIALALYLLLLKGSQVQAALIVLSGFLIKEVAGIIISGYGLFLIFFRKEKLVGILLFLAGLAGAAFLIKEIVPQFNSQHIYVFMGYYSHFGNNIYEQLFNMFAHPLRTAGFLFSSNNLLYLFLLFAPLAFLPLFRPALLIIALPVLLENLLSNYRFQKNISVQYSYVLLPILFYSSVLGIKQLKDSGKWDSFWQWGRKCIIFFAALSLLAFVLLNLRQYIPSQKVFSAHKLMQIIPPNASVSASNHLLVHLQYRDHLRFFPDYGQEEFIVFEDVDHWLLSEHGSDQAKIGKLWGAKDYSRILSYLIMGMSIPDSTYVKTMARLSHENNYKLIAHENGIFLYKHIPMRSQPAGEK